MVCVHAPLSVVSIMPFFLPEILCVVAVWGPDSLARLRRRSPAATLARRSRPVAPSFVVRRPPLFVGSFARSTAQSIALILPDPESPVGRSACCTRPSLGRSCRRSSAVALFRLVHLVGRPSIGRSLGSLLVPPARSLARSLGRSTSSSVVSCGRAWTAVVARSVAPSVVALRRFIRSLEIVRSLESLLEPPARSLGRSLDRAIAWPRRSKVSWAALGRRRRSASLGRTCRRSPADALVAIIRTSDKIYIISSAKI